MTQPESPTNEAIAHETEKVLHEGHKVLLDNTIIFKEFLMNPNSYKMFNQQLLEGLETSSDVSEQVRLLAVLEELNVRDTTRIGEPLIDTLKHDLQTKAEGKFEFKKGDRNLALAMLELLEEDGQIAGLISRLCEEQVESGMATPFDYRRLTLGYDGSFETATPEQWLRYFHHHTSTELSKYVEVGRSFASTRPQRYEEEEYDYLSEKLRGKVGKLLDIGGSTGVSANHLMSHLEIPEAMVSDARTEEELQASFYGKFKRQSNIKYVLGREGNITRTTPTDETFDLVTVNNVLVHIRDKETALSNILPRVNEGGHLIVSGGYNTNPPRSSLKIFKSDASGLKLEREFKND